ncbi:MAG: hypothetical protein JWO50_481 [Candidatus Kaiserbacteria bacterium]|nr:hypothetical protein [Candidatus Kaiserbacteria bacterium]
MKKVLGTIGLLSMMTLGSGLAFAQTTTTDTTTAAPGVPSTGAGGDMATNIAVLGLSAVVVVGGAVYLLRKPNRLTQ